MSLCENTYEKKLIFHLSFFKKEMKNISVANLIHQVSEILNLEQFEIEFLKQDIENNEADAWTEIIQSIKGYDNIKQSFQNLCDTQLKSVNRKSVSCLPTTS